VTAEPIGPATWAPNPARQRQRDYSVEDVLALPEEAPRVELDNGVLIVVPKPSYNHQNTANLLWMWFWQNSPPEFRPVTEVGVTMGWRDTLEPDVLLLRWPVANHHYFEPTDTVIVIEVVSPGTKRRDRLEKPALYAQAGIPHFWRIEQDPVHVHAYDLVDGKYQLAAESAEELVLKAPFGIKLPIRDITP
jgi:Uma2 family endonuclease